MIVADEWAEGADLLDASASGGVSVASVVAEAPEHSCSIRSPEKTDKTV